MKKILVPTDFSENAYNALSYGVNLFAEDECVFYILHSYTPALYNAKFMVSGNLSIDEIYSQKVNKSLSKVINRIKMEIPVKEHSFKKIARSNLLQDEIKNQVKTKEIDLIIMGTQGATGAAHILFGTNTIHTMEGSTCTVLAIPANAEFTTPSNLLFATDFEPDVTENHLEIIKEIAVKFHSKIHILHINQDKPLDPVRENNKNILSTHFKNFPHHFHSLEMETVTQGISHFQKDNPVDILVMVRHKHSFFQNLFFRPVVDKIGLHWSTPFLIIPVLKEE